MSTKNKQPKTKKQSTSTTQLVMASTSTQSTEIATAATTLDACPDEILLHIAMYVGAHSCYLGYGVVNKRLNHLFKTYSTKLSKSTSYGGYAPFQEIVQRCEKKFEKGKENYHYYTPEIFYQLASGAVTFNRTDLLEWVIEKQNKFLHRVICVRAIKDKKLSIFQKVWNSIGNENMMTYMKQQTWFIRIAVEKGYLNWLIYLREELGCEWNSGACYWAARCGKLDCLVYLHEHGFQWNSDACSEAASNGHLDCLVYLHEHGCEWNKYACYDAARNGHLDCLVYLHEHGCEWDSDACYWAASNGHLDCLRYMRDNGLEWDRYDEYLGNKVKDSDP